MTARGCAFLALVAAVPLLACGADGAGREVVARDSAGVRIVESSGSRWGAEDAWRLGEPALTIGRREGEEAYLFHGIAGAKRLSDGRIVVADAASNQLRFFDAEARFLGAVGRAGDGPGEYRFMSALAVLAGDTLAVTDLAGITILDPDGAYARTIRMGMAGERMAHALGLLAGGAILGASGSRGFGPADAGTVIRDTLRFYAFRPDGAFVREVVALPGAERWGLAAGGRYSFPYVPFAGGPVWAAGRDHFHVGTGVDADLRVYGEEGGLERVSRWEVPARQVTDEDRAALRSHLLASARTDNARRRDETFLAEAPQAERMPRYQAAVVDAEQNVWLERYRAPWEAGPIWDIIDPGGAWLGAVETPPRFEIRQIGPDFVLGTWRDEADVAYVRVYALMKPE
ncbi:MAG TPA: 6-bladed beta-propeller [Longimicrobiales bacterium]|nr:6-bladed beta-propeller [Longimicrobiales bacterium]